MDIGIEKKCKGSDSLSALYPLHSLKADILPRLTLDPGISFPILKQTT